MRRLPTKQPTLSDGVVTLTPFTGDDASTMVEWDHDRDMARWFDWPLQPRTPDDLRHAQQVVERWQREYALSARGFPGLCGTLLMIASSARWSFGPELMAVPMR